MTTKEIKQLSREEFKELTHYPDEVYDALQKSKEGWLSISRTSDRAGKAGHTYTFGEGISVRIDGPDGWYVTSVIQKIDWKNKEFTTLNSVYKFNFIPDE